MNKCIERLYNGVIKENPTFVQLLGMCPTLAVTSTAINGLGMGLATTAVLTMSNLMISALRKHIPDKVRIPAFITIIASFVTIISFLMQAYTPDLYDSLGVFISLIVVNCIILGRAEAYASKNPVIPSIFDGLGMGLGFTVGLTMIGIIREFLGAGKIFGITITAKLWDPIAIFTSNPGAFFVLAFLVAGLNAFAIRKAKKKGEKPKLRRIDTCAGCTNLACAGRAAGAEDLSGSGKTLPENCEKKEVSAQEKTAPKTEAAAQELKAPKNGAAQEKAVPKKEAVTHEKKALKNETAAQEKTAPKNDAAAQEKNTKDETAGTEKKPEKDGMGENVKAAVSHAVKEVSNLAAKAVGQQEKEVVISKSTVTLDMETGAVSSGEAVKEADKASGSGTSRSKGKKKGGKKKEVKK